MLTLGLGQIKLDALLLERKEAEKVFIRKESKQLGSSIKLNTLTVVEESKYPEQKIQTMEDIAYKK